MRFVMPGRVLFISTVLAVLVQAGAATAQLTNVIPSLRELQDRVGYIEQQMQAMGQAISQVSAQVGQASGAQTQQSLGQLEDLRSEMQRLNRQVEDLRFKLDDVQSINARLDRLEARLDQQQAAPFVSIGQSSNLAAQPETQPFASASSQQGLAQAEGAEQAYQQAFSLIQSGDYNAALQAFQAFRDEYPNDTLVQNADYWSGEAYYAQSDYESAAYHFSEAFKRDKEGLKAPDALLKLAYSLFALGRAPEGCTMLGAVIDKYPNASQNVLDKAVTTMGERGC